MRALDRRLRDLRIREALPWVRPGDRFLDIGCFDQTLIRRVAPRVREAVGVDPLAEPASDGNLRVLRGQVPGAPLPTAGFDCVTMLAVLEHVADKAPLAAECARVLSPGGRLVITVPDARVDRILAVLRALGLVDGMSVEEHHGFDASRTADLFTAAGFRLLRHRRFELGLNNLYVFERGRA